MLFRSSFPPDLAKDVRRVLDMLVMKNDDISSRYYIVNLGGLNIAIPDVYKRQVLLRESSRSGTAVLQGEPCQTGEDAARRVEQGGNKEDTRRDGDRPALLLHVLHTLFRRIAHQRTAATLDCQRTEPLKDKDGTRGFFYRDKSRKSIVHYIHQSREQVDVYKRQVCILVSWVVEIVIILVLSMKLLVSRLNTKSFDK